MSQVQKPQTLRGKTAWWAAVTVVFIVAVLAFLILVKPAPQNTPQAGEGTTQPTEGCNVPEGDTSSKPAMPVDLRWEADKGWTWPVSDTYGPTDTKDGFPVCFARSPLGAALTAVSMNASANVISARKAVELYTMESKGKDVLLGKTPDEPAATSPASFAGFIVDSFTGDEAAITLVMATPISSTGYTGLPGTFKWVDGDWKLKILDDGSSFVGQPPVPVKGGFVEWVGSNG
ncbi:hypothetical protein [Arthrobacter sp. B1I2]|uniref:hypothetical protein n=1 Tax=Arthrobacter sp. B1I2 TaxID=3042263 RepID=UPI00277EFA06|nr:hypothetical protein [Arthrobacter sp. B1I2]MDQ0733507.1 hypothetical protein [Arthrobacter sp. B1I2]